MTRLADKPFLVVGNKNDEENASENIKRFRIAFDHSSLIYFCGFGGWIERVAIHSLKIKIIKFLFLNLIYTNACANKVEYESNFCGKKGKKGEPLHIQEVLKRRRPRC